MSIYTRRGDAGETSLADGSRVAKDSSRVEAYGAVDELNSAVGFARAAVSDELLGGVLRFIQQRLFNCSSSLATPAAARGGSTPEVSADDVGLLERAVDRFEAVTGPLERFVLEAGGETCCRLHLARAVARRAERRIVTLAATEAVEPHVLAFVNRTSDALFAAARYASAVEGTPEESWDPAAPHPSV